MSTEKTRFNDVMEECLMNLLKEVDINFKSRPKTDVKNNVGTKSSEEYRK